MTRVVFHTSQDFHARSGSELGVSSWHPIDQAEIDRFADATHDHHWLHVDPRRAATTDFGGTIAHGYLTLCLHPHLMGEIWELRGFPYGLNYGLDRVRFPAPVPVDARVRLRATLEDVRDIPAGVQIRVGLVFECDQGDKPVCVASWLAQYYPADGAAG